MMKPSINKEKLNDIYKGFTEEQKKAVNAITFCAVVKTKKKILEQKKNEKEKQ